MAFLTALRRPLSAFAAPSRFLPLFFGPRLHFSSAASNSDLLRVIDSEIRCAEDSVDHYWMGEVPDRFPFDLKDEPGASAVVLTRNYDSERIEVAASMPNLVTGEDDDDDDDANTEDPAQSSVPLIVKLSKGDNLSMVFRCTAFPDEISVDGMSVKENKDPNHFLAYEGRDFSELGDDIQSCFRRYLEMRGITPQNMNFLHEYMINKDGREYLLWLKNLKAFINK